jgi:hypothetical protein
MAAEDASEPGASLRNERPGACYPPTTGQKISNENKFIYKNLKMLCSDGISRRSKPINRKNYYKKKMMTIFWFYSSPNSVDSELDYTK